MNSARINNISRIQPIVSSNPAYRKHNTSVFDSKLPITFDAYMIKSKSMNNQSKTSNNLNRIKE